MFLTDNYGKLLSIFCLQIEQNPDLIKTSDTTTATVNNNNKFFGVRRSWKKPLKKKDKSSKKNGDLENGKNFVCP